MLKKALLSLIILSAVLCISSCTKEKKQLSCDGCGQKVEVDIDSNMNEDWIVFCSECGEPEITFESPFDK